MYASLIIALITAPAGIFAHGVLQEPVPRTTGAAQLELCGVNVTKVFKADEAAPIEDALEKVHEDYNCDAYMCKGYQYEDNVDNVKVYAAGEIVTFHIDLIASHKPGYANVSVIDLSTNTIIGQPLKSWDLWPDNVAGGGDDIDFNITIPDSLDSACSVGGKCAIQWYWFSRSNSQTYESCVDFFIANN